MAAVELTFSGVLYDKYNRTQQNVVLIGEASLTGVGVGGGPIIPPGGGGGQPPNYPNVPPHPAFPIWGGPGAGFPGGPGYPPVVGGGPMPPGQGGGGQPPHPAFPIWGGPGAGFPDKPGYPPVVGGGPIVPPDKPPEPIQPPVEWKAVWAGPEYGWVVVGIPTGEHPSPST